MNISKAMMENIKVQLEVAPLADGEVRRVEGMGELFVSLKKEAAHPYYFKYSLEIDKTPHYFFGLDSPS